MNRSLTLLTLAAAIGLTSGVTTVHADTVQNPAPTDHSATAIPAIPVVPSQTPPPPTAPTGPPAVLQDGAQAPDFTVKDPGGNPIKLSDYHGKVVVLDFWATWCGPCQASMPHTNGVAEKFKGKDVVFLAINTSDTSDAFKAWLPKHKNYEALNFVIDDAPRASNIAHTLYHVYGIPTQFVIDKTGKVTNSFVGYGAPNDDLENAIIAAGG